MSEYKFLELTEAMIEDAKVQMMYGLYVTDRNLFDVTMLPCKVTMPCGNSLEMHTMADVPAVGVYPCPCGNPNHILAKVE